MSSNPNDSQIVHVQDHSIYEIHQQLICHDESHCHNSPVQNMIGIEVNGHWVEATQDGDVYHVRIDSDPETVVGGLTEQEANTYVQLMTSIYVESEL